MDPEKTRHKPKNDAESRKTTAFRAARAKWEGLRVSPFCDKDNYRMIDAHFDDVHELSLCG